MLAAGCTAPSGCLKLPLLLLLRRMGPEPCPVVALPRPAPRTVTLEFCASRAGRPLRRVAPKPPCACEAGQPGLWAARSAWVILSSWGLLLQRWVLGSGSRRLGAGDSKLDAERRDACTQTTPLAMFKGAPAPAQPGSHSSLLSAAPGLAQHLARSRLQANRLSAQPLSCTTCILPSATTSSLGGADNCTCPLGSLAAQCIALHSVASSRPWTLSPEP